MPIHLRDEMIFDLAHLQVYGIITTLTNSKNISPVFAQRKPSGKLRILHDLRKINHLLRLDYANLKFLIFNMTDAVNHFAEKNVHKIGLFASVSLRSNGLSVLGTIACIQFRIQDIRKILAKSLSKSVTGFNAFVQKYLDQCLAANLCTQFMDIGSGAENIEEKKEILIKILARIQKSGLKLSPENCQFGMSQISFSDNTITSEGITPETKRIEKFLGKVKTPQTV